MSSRTITGNTTLTATDAGLEIRVNSVSGVTVTIPASVFSVGDSFSVRRIGTGNVTVEAASGVTLNDVSQGTATTTKSYQLFYVEQTAADEWTLAGNVVDTSANSEEKPSTSTTFKNINDPDTGSDSFTYAESLVLTLTSDKDQVTHNLKNPTTAPSLVNSYDLDAAIEFSSNTQKAVSTPSAFADDSFDYGEVMLDVLKENKMPVTTTLEPSAVDPRVTPIIVLG